MIKPIILAGIIAVASLLPAVAEAQFSLSGRVSRENSDSAGRIVDESHVAFLASASVDYQAGRWRFGGNFTDGDSSTESFFFGSGSEYKRTWKELYAGYSVSPVVEVVGGVRDDRIEVVQYFFATESLFKVEQTLPFAGIRYHKHPGRVGVEVSALYYRGTADVTEGLVDTSGDATGIRIQVALPIRVGQSRSVITPGYDHENFDVGSGANQRGDRLFVQYTYTFRP